MIYNFKTQLAKGKLVESALDEFFEKKGYAISSVSLEEEKLYGYDRVFTHGDRRIKVEYKADWKAEKTGNAFVEISVRSDSGENAKNGWYYTQADVVVYAIMSEEKITNLFYIDPIKLRSMGFLDFKQAQCYNNGYYSIGVLVPLNKLEECKVSNG